MITLIGKAIGPPIHASNEGATEGHVAVAKVLLSHGARCNARDLFGKTILHYAVGPLYTKPGRGADILQIAELCLEHAKRMNICNPNFIDYRDRFGSVALFMAIQLNQLALVRTLCVKHHADVTIKDVDNFSPLDASRSQPAIYRIMEKVHIVLPSHCYFAKSLLTIITGTLYHTEVLHLHTYFLIIYLILSLYSNQQARTGVLLESTCRVCLKDLATPLKCSICKVPHYCSADCQKKDWIGHKPVCRIRSDSGFTIIPPAATTLKELSKKKMVDVAVGKVIKYWDGSVPKPSLLFPEMGKQFDVLVRINGNNSLTIHTEDKSDLYTMVDQSQCDNYDALKQLVIDFAGGNIDKKVYLRAVMNEEGKIFVSSLQKFYRRWVG